MNRFLLFKLIFSCSIFLLLVKSTTAQEETINNKRGVEVEFVEKKTEQLSNELSSNVLKIKNNSSKEISFSVNISTPDGWKYLTKKINHYTIKPYDSAFVPVNLVPQKTSSGNVNHIINASLINDNNAQFASAIWYMNIKKESNWNASALQNKIFFLNQSDTARFAIKLQNTGNAEEKIKINFLSDRRIKVFDINTKAELQYYNIFLPVNTDTILFFSVQKVKPLQNTFREDFDYGSQKPQSDVFPLRITVQNEAEDNNTSKTWRGTIDFIKAGTEARLKEKASVSLPLTIEATVDNLLESSTILNVSMYGNAQLNGNRSLSYRFQTFFVDNFYSYKPYLGNSHYIGYATPKTTLELGDVNGNSNFGFSPTGRGIKASQQVFKNHTVGGFYLQGPNFFNDHTNTDYGLSYLIRIGRASIDNYVQHTDNSLLTLTGTQYSNRLRFNLLKYHNFTINTAYSNETYTGDVTPVKKSGYAYLVNYSGSVKKFYLSFTNSLGSQYNTGYRGIRSLGADVLYPLGKKSNINAGFFKFDQNPQYYSSTGLFLNSGTNISETYELRYSFNPEEYNFTLKLQHLYNEAFNLRSEANGLGLDYRPKSKGEIRFFLSLYGAYIKLLDYSITPYFSSQIRTTVRYRGLTTNLRYFYGPYQTYEQLLFARTKVNNQSIFSNTNIKLWVLKNTLSFEPSVIYSYESLFKRNRVSLRPEIYYTPKSGLELKFYAQYINNSQKNNPFQSLATEYDNIATAISSSNLFFGFGVKKRLGVPVSARKFKKLTILIFKDLNGNGKQDKNEPGLKNVLVNVKAIDSARFNNGLKEIGENFITTEGGKVIYNNLPVGAYKISIIPLSETSGFFAGNEQIVMVDKDIVYPMPLNQGVNLSGTLAVERDPTTADPDAKIDVSKIRVTAMDSLGKTYSTLTDASGRFSIRLPVGLYQISINENALPENFELEHKRITVEMFTVANNYNITFLLREKKRKLNIRKFNQQGKLIENKQ